MATPCNENKHRFMILYLGKGVRKNTLPLFYCPNRTS